MQNTDGDSVAPNGLPEPDNTATNGATNVQSSAPSNAALSLPLSIQNRNAPRVNPLWIAIGIATIFGLVFGAQAFAGSPSLLTTPSSVTGEQATINAIQKVNPSVVQIQGRNGGAGNGGGSVGSGEILTTSGFIVTNDHVVRGFSQLTTLLADGRTFSAQLVGEAPSQDLAVLKISARNLKPIAVANSSRVQVGQYAIAVGSPLGLEQSATSGIVSALNRQANIQANGATYTLTDMIQTSAPINPGNSGGALINLNGQLIGIPTLGAVDPTSGVAANGIGFAISSNRMESIVSQLTRGAA